MLFYIYIQEREKRMHILLYSTTNIKSNPSNYPLNNIISESACFAKFVENVHKNVINYAVSRKKSRNVMLPYFPLTFYETIYTSELYQNVKRHSPKF